MIKPIIIAIDKNKNGDITLSLEEFESKINQAFLDGYNQGYSEGYQAYNKPYLWYDTYGTSSINANIKATR